MPKPSQCFHRHRPILLCDGKPRVHPVPAKATPISSPNKHHASKIFPTPSSSHFSVWQCMPDLLSPLDLWVVLFIQCICTGYHTPGDGSVFVSSIVAWILSSVSSSVVMWLTICERKAKDQMWCICIFCICTLRAMQCLVYLYFERKAVLVRRFHSRGLIPPTRCRRPSQWGPNTTITQKPRSPKYFEEYSPKYSEEYPPNMTQISWSQGPSQWGPNTTITQKPRNPKYSEEYPPNMTQIPWSQDVAGHPNETYPRPSWHHRDPPQHPVHLGSRFRPRLKHLVVGLRFGSHRHRGGDQKRLKICV